nr:reverse transcriptase domain, reverse transcriptase zinc-binding domain protein [Tanacetum cinerariifolium]
VFMRSHIKMMDMGLFKGASVGQGLKINVHKSNIIGVNVPNHVTDVMAKNVGCCVASFPLQYLSVHVGFNMSRCANWIPIIRKFSSKPAQWEARLLSVGGRLSLIKSVLGNLPTYYMSLYMMPMAIHKKLEMIRNKFFIGGEEGGINEDRTHHTTWGAILSSVKRLKLKGIDLFSLCKIKLGNGSLTSFWDDTWCGNSPLKYQFPRIYMLDSDKGCKV